MKPNPIWAKSNFSLTKLFVALLTVLMICSCNGANTKDNKTAIKATGPFGAFAFKELIYDFGKINNGDVVQHTFKYNNVGKAPLIIKDISTSCGCTIVKWDKNPVKPNQSGEITVEFSKKSDPGVHYKNIIIKANTEDPYTVIHIKAFIKQA